MNKNTYFLDKLRELGLRPTKQRLKLCDILFNRDETFHFTVNDIFKVISKEFNEKISLATVYNTIHALKKKGYLKEILIDGNQSYFDTNLDSHHHFYDYKTSELVDINKDSVEILRMPSPPSGKKIEGLEVIFKITDK